MASIARTLSLPWSPKGTIVGTVRGNVNTRTPSGGAFGYTELDEPLRRYKIRPTLMLDSGSELEQWAALVGQVHRDDGILWIAEPISVVNRGLRCGPITNGTRTTYPIPVIDPADVTVFVDGVPQDSGDYTLHSAANMLTDGDAIAADLTLYTETNMTAAEFAGFGLVSPDCIKVDPDAASTCVFQPTLSDAPVTVEGDVRTALTAVFPLVDDGKFYNTRIRWYTSGDAYIDTENGDAHVLDGGVWNILTNTQTAPATTGKTLVGSRYHNNAGDETQNYFMGAFGVAPGDYDVWHLPSLAPGLVEFDTAPAAGARVTATATGRRLTRCSLYPTTEWSASSRHPTVQTIEAVEAVEI